MKHRTTLKICGIRVALEVNDPGGWANNGLGRSSEVACRILVRSGMGKDQELSVLMHEVVHMIDSINGLELSETQVSVLGAATAAFLLDNDLTKYFVEESDNG